MKKRLILGGSALILGAVVFVAYPEKVTSMSNNEVNISNEVVEKEFLSSVPYSSIYKFEEHKKEEVVISEPDEEIVASEDAVSIELDNIESVEENQDYAQSETYQEETTFVNEVSQDEYVPEEVVVEEPIQEESSEENHVELPATTQWYYDDATIFLNYHYNYQGYAGTIYIPSVGLYTDMQYGSTQDDINTYDIVSETDGNLFGMSGYNTACGHNTRSLGALHNCSVGDRIYVYTDYALFVYEITLAEVGHIDESGCNIISDTTGNVIFKYGYDAIDSFKMYTCYEYGNPTSATPTNNRFVINAKLVQ